MYAGGGARTRTMRALGGWWWSQSRSLYLPTANQRRSIAVNRSPPASELASERARTFDSHSSSFNNFRGALVQEFRAVTLEPSTPSRLLSMPPTVLLLFLLSPSARYLSSSSYRHAADSEFFNLYTLIIQFFFYFITLLTLPLHYSLLLFAFILTTSAPNCSFPNFYL